MKEAKIFKLWMGLVVGSMFLWSGCSHVKYVTITSEPNEAAVYLNGQDKGVTMYKEKLEFTDEIPEFKVLLQKKGYFDGKTTIQYEPKKKKIYHIDLEALNKTVNIISSPDGATVYINGVEEGITPLSKKLEFHEIESYDVILKKDRYEDKTFTIAFEPELQTSYPSNPELEVKIAILIALIDVEPALTSQGVKLRIIEKSTLAYLEVIERSPNARSVTRITNNEDPLVSLGAPVLSPKEDTLMYQVLVEEEGKNYYSNLWRTTIGAVGKTRVTYGKWEDLYPTFTPDGNDIVFSANRVGVRTLWQIKTAGSGGLVNITNTLSEDYSPSVSSVDGTIVYTSHPPNAEEPQIWKVRSDGSLPTQLREGEFPQISPDGTRILFTREDKITKMGQIWLMDLDGGRETQLTQNVDYDIETTPRWSPDGKHLVFSSNEGLDSKKRQNPDIWMMTKDGSQKTQLTTNGSQDDNPCWDAQGKFIYFRSNRGGTWNIWRFEPVMEE